MVQRYYTGIGFGRGSSSLRGLAHGAPPRAGDVPAYAVGIDVSAADIVAEPVLVPGFYWSLATGSAEVRALEAWLSAWRATRAVTEVRRVFEPWWRARGAVDRLWVLFQVNVPTPRGDVAVYRANEGANTLPQAPDRAPGATPVWDNLPTGAKVAVVGGVLVLVVGVGSWFLGNTARLLGR